MSVHAFVDETMRGGYYMAAALMVPKDLARVRKAISALLLSGQRRIHFNTERDSRRRQILSTIVELQPEVVIYDASGHRDDRAARQACLEALVDDLAARRAHRLVIERADSLLTNDQRILYARVHKTGCADTLTYVHQRTHEEPLLTIPDAVAWCWTKGGHWRSTISQIVARVDRV